MSGVTHSRVVVKEPLCCPLGKKARLHLVVAEGVFAECFLEGPGRCPKSFSFGGGNYCRALWKFERP